MYSVPSEVERHLVYMYAAYDVLMPDMGAGRCLGPEGNGVSLGEGDEGGASPPESKEEKQSVLSEEGGSMEKEEEGRMSRA
jgi:hypothetical protein